MAAPFDITQVLLNAADSNLAVRTQAEQQLMAAQEANYGGGCLQVALCPAWAASMGLDAQEQWGAARGGAAARRAAGPAQGVCSGFQLMQQACMALTQALPQQLRLPALRRCHHLWLNPQPPPRRACPTGLLAMLAAELANGAKPAVTRQLAGLVMKNALDAKDEARKTDLQVRPMRVQTMCQSQRLSAANSCSLWSRNGLQILAADSPCA